MTIDQGNKGKNETDGLVWVQGKQVLVKNGCKEGMPPVINPCEEIELYINGDICKHLTTVSEDDVIELKPVIIELEQQVDIEITEDKQKCYLRFTPAMLVGHTVIDSPPVNKLDIKATQVVLEKKKTDPQQILDYLSDANINYGICMDTLKKICENNEPGYFLIAEGLPPKDGTDYRMEYFFNVSGTRFIKPDENSMESIDYKNTRQYETVTAGQQIAQLHKGNPGVNGTSVTGEVLVPAPRKVLTIAQSFSIRYDEETGAVRANKAGRSFCEEKGDIITFQIYDCVSLDEVSMETGNVRFKGDIEIKSNVYESMEVAARQNVLVKGNVIFASIYAGNNITIKGCAISSKINAALNNIAAKDPAPLIEKLTEEIGKLINNINQFPVENMNSKQFNYVLKKLLNSKNKDLPSKIYEILYAFKKDNYDIQDELVLSLIKKTGSLMGNYSNIPDIEYLYQINSEMELLLSGQKSTPVKGEVILNNITNCKVSALGNIIVLGKGCINSSLYSMSKVFAYGLVRGGKIKAGKGIEINIAGTERGSKILLEVPSNGYIKIQTAYADTMIKVGPISYTFLTKKKKIYARIENNKLLF